MDDVKTVVGKFDDATGFLGSQQSTDLDLTPSKAKKARFEEKEISVPSSSSAPKTPGPKSEEHVKHKSKAHEVTPSKKETALKKVKKEKMPKASGSAKAPKAKKAKSK